MPIPDPDNALSLNQQHFRDADDCNINMVCVFCDQTVLTEDDAIPGFYVGDTEYCDIEATGQSQCVCNACVDTHVDYDEETGVYDLKPDHPLPARALIQCGPTERGQRA